MSGRFLLAALFVFQVLCAGVFLYKLLIALLPLPVAPINWQVFELIEIGAALGLVLGATVGFVALRRSLRDAARMRSQLRLASGAFFELMQDHFDEWGLTPAERDVAQFALKGLSLQEIADLRNTSPGTVKAQTNAIYRKAGVSGRTQLLSLFIDDLMSGELKRDAAPGATPLRKSA